MEEPETEEARLSREEQDREYAEILQAKEQAKLKRAKERAKLKKQQQRQQQQDINDIDHHQRQHSGDYSQQHHHHERALSQPLSLVSVGQVSGGRTESRQSRRSEGGALQNGRHSRTSANSRSFEEDVRPPARRPYMNPGKNVDTYF
jgi:hypothetical protein